MKKLLILFVCTLTESIISNAACGAAIDASSAKTVASNFYSSNCDKEIKNITVAFTVSADDGSVAYYIFNVNNNDGFVIVTADDAALPIIGYATTGHYDDDNIAPQLANMLNSRKEEISYIKSNQLAATQNIKEQWQIYRIKQNSNPKLRGGVNPLCTTIWDQISPYNALCPYDNNFGIRTVTGCVATTMAQIMKYWNYPAHGYGSFSYNVTTSNGFQHSFGVLTADFQNTTYDWANMSDPILGITSVATLIYHCGVSVGMDYGSGFNDIGSNANVVPFDSLAWRNPYGGKVCAQTAFSQFFGYDSVSMQGVQKNSYTEAAWDSLIENELDNGRPILYAGYTDNTKQEGHAWLCDGYDNNNYFHMNWGWSGHYNGFFTLNNLNPSTYQFNKQEEALIGIKPVSIFTGVKENNSGNPISIYPNPSNGKFMVYNLPSSVSEVDIYNIVGKKVYQSAKQQSNKSIIDLSPQPAGTYFMHLQNAKEVVIEKLIKI